MQNNNISLLAVAFGAILAMVSGIVTQYFIHHFEEKRSAEALLRSKAEELVDALYMFFDWIDDYYKKVTFDDDEYSMASPFNRVHMLCLLYFPELRLVIMELKIAANPLMQLALEERDARGLDIKDWSMNYDSTEYLNKRKIFCELFDNAVIEIAKNINNR